MRRDENMGILYIIGNGFDRHFNLPTSPENFMKILKTKSIYNECDNAYDIMDTYCVNWSKYEQSLADINLDEIECQNLIGPDYLSDHESDRDGGILNMQMYLGSINEAISSALNDMVGAANAEVERKRLSGEQYQCFSEGDAILSFNYTSTIEKLFVLPENIPILHIHGFYEANSPLIFGYKNVKGNYKEKIEYSLQDGDYYITEQRKMIYAFYENWKKVIQMPYLNNFLMKCQGIDKIVVLGHSMAEVDSEYMEQIERVLHPEVWKISCHNDDIEVQMNAQMYSFAPKINFFPW